MTIAAGIFLVYILARGRFNDYSALIQSKAPKTESE